MFYIILLNTFVYVFKANDFIQDVEKDLGSEDTYYLLKAYFMLDNILGIQTHLFLNVQTLFANMTLLFEN